MEDFNRYRYISLATFRSNGKEVRTPVWFANDGPQKIYCFTAENAGKVKRLRRDNRARVASCDISGGSLGSWIDAKAYMVDEDVEQARGYQLLIGKYRIQMRIARFLSWLTGKINHQSIIRIELDNES